jgi:tRNA pseudouridine38-40 synthase
MPRYRITLEYDGGPFVGWQVQALGQSVQGRLAAAIAKFSAETVLPRAAARHYRYRMLARAAPPVLERDRVWWVRRHIDDRAMASAARCLLGRHDFTTFRAAGCQAASPLKTLDRLAITRQGEEIRIEASARSFLHHQVRSIVGSLKLVGDGTWREADLHSALEARDRSACGPVAPARGLYLVRVEYPAEDSQTVARQD